MTAISNALTRMIGSIASTIRRDDGQTMAEYGLILAAIAVVVMVAALVLGTAITGKFTEVTTALG